MTFLKIVCVLQMIHILHDLTTTKISMLVLGLHNKDRKSTKDKANINNPKAHTDCLRKPRGSAIVNIILPPRVLFYCREIYFHHRKFYFTVTSFIFTAASFILLPWVLFYRRKFYFHHRDFNFHHREFYFTAVRFILPLKFYFQVKSRGSKIKLSAEKIKLAAVK